MFIHRSQATDARRRSDEAAPRAMAFINDAIERGVPFRVTSDFRDTDRQRELYENRRPDQLVGLPGTSSHEAGLALDINWNQLSSVEQGTVLSMARYHGLVQSMADRNDPVHFFAGDWGGNPTDAILAAQAALRMMQRTHTWRT